MTPSKYQTAIYDHIASRSANLSVNAVAGSGKTTTLVEAARLLPADQFHVFLAFSKLIAETLKQRLPAACDAVTLNALGWRAWRRLYPDCELRPHKVRAIIKEIVPAWAVRSVYGQPASKLVALAKANALRIDDDAAKWVDLADNYGLADHGVDGEKLVWLARSAMQRGLETATDSVDFDDQVYMPVLHGLDLGDPATIFVDEAQDLNPIQHDLLKLMGGRLVAVGDPRQACYAFRGADARSFDNMRLHWKCEELPLSVCYRCARDIVKLAKGIVPHIEWFEPNPAGRIEHLDEWGPWMMREDDVVLCRNNAPLVKLAYALIRAGRGCRMLGRDIGTQLVAFVERFKEWHLAKDMLNEMERWVSAERKRLEDKYKFEAADSLLDRFECVQAVVEGMPMLATVQQLMFELGVVFADSNSGLTLSTCHKSKGLEWDRVFILEQQLMPARWAKQQWELEQERNLRYVAITRAKRELYWVEMVNFKAQQPVRMGVSA